MQIYPLITETITANKTTTHNYIKPTWSNGHEYG